MSSGGSVETDPLLSTSPVTTPYYGKPSQPQPISELVNILYHLFVLPFISNSEIVLPGDFK